MAATAGEQLSHWCRVQEGHVDRALPPPPIKTLHEPCHVATEYEAAVIKQKRKKKELEVIGLAMNLIPAMSTSKHNSMTKQVST